MSKKKDKPELTPEEKALKAQKGRRDGYLMIFLALVCFAVGAYFRESASAHYKLLVQHGDNGQIFDQSVIFMLRHDRSGGYGLIVNRPDEKNTGYYYGGPVEPDKIAGLYTQAEGFDAGVPVGHTGLYYIEGADAEKLRDLDPPPAWFIVTRGYAGWGSRQLDRELLRERWKIVDMDLPLVTETTPEFMWRAATEKASIAEEAQKRGVEPSAIERERSKPPSGI